VLALDYAALGLLFALYPLVHSLVPFIVIASLTSIGEISASPLRSALMNTVFTPQQAVRVRAQTRGAFNVGFMLGAAVAGLALATASHQAFWAVCAGNALAQTLCVFVVLRLPAHDPAPSTGPAGGRLRSAVRDFPFLAVTLCNGLLELHSSVLTAGIPLWILRRTAASPSLNSVVIIGNTVTVLLLQVRLSRGADTARASARLQRRGGLVLAAGCLVFAASQGAGAVRGTAIMLAGTLVLAVGEIFQAAGGWGLSFLLPPPGRQGEYQGVFALGRGIQQIVGPTLVTSLLVGVGAVGWLVLAALFTTIGLAAVPLVARADRAGGGAGSGGHQARHRMTGHRRRSPHRRHQGVRTPPRHAVSDRN
jgi:hypothetical protein